MTTSPERCNYKHGSFVCRGAAYYHGDEGARCYPHRPEQLERAALREAERIRSDAERGVRRCGVITLQNRPCHRIAMQGKPTCPHHEPGRQESLKQATIDYVAAKRREHEVWAVKRKVELEHGLAGLQARHNALVQDDINLRREVRDTRDTLARLRRMRDETSAQLDTVAAELLELARAFVSSGAGAAFTAERCDLAIRYADALTNHAREKRLAARPQPGEPRITHVGFDDPRLTD
jgi:hypothetical protein